LNNALTLAKINGFENFVASPQLIVFTNTALNNIGGL
jgi:hypothetical protein